MFSPWYPPFRQNLPQNHALGLGGLAHSLRQISLVVSRPYAHVVRSGLFNGFNGLIRAALLLLQQDKAVGLEGGFAGVGLAGQQVGVAAGRQGDGMALAAEVEQADQLFPFGLAPDAEDGKAAGVEGVDGGRRLKGGILPPDRFQLPQPGKDAAGRAGAVRPLGGARPGQAPPVDIAAVGGLVGSA